MNPKRQLQGNLSKLPIFTLVIPPLQLWAMNIIYVATKERGTTILIPNSMVDSLNPSTSMLALVLATKVAADPETPYQPQLEG
jgi:3-hydroxyisobutyrate dehydrogenase-like beta-hydroxyacid dehydrogenase